MKKVYTLLFILSILIGYEAKANERDITVDELYRGLNSNNTSILMYFMGYCKGVVQWEFGKNKNNSKCMSITPQETIDYFMAMYQRKEFEIGISADVAMLSTLVKMCPDLLK